MAFRMRSSKFRHIFGSPARKENCYECVRITRNAHDASFCAVNPKFIAIVTESAGGGSFLVLPLDKTGRVDINVPKVCGHSGPVLDIKWNPFSDNVIASCSDDATVKLWEIPDGGLKGNLTEWLVDLHGHQKRVSYIEWHPTARDILLSAGYDFKCILWNTETAEPINIISVHSDTIFSISWNHDGSLFASTSKDKKIRVIDPREGTVIAEGVGHEGSKASKVVFLGDKNKLFTTGFSRMSERQLAVWEARNLSKPLKIDIIDSSSGVLSPFYDIDTGVVFVAGKGDGNIRYYEITSESPYVHYLSQYQSPNPQRGLGILPKRGVDPSKCEIVRFYKLHATKGLCEPVSMIVPRKSEMFQDDIFPPTASATPSLSADEWISGQNREPILISLKDGNLMPCPKVKVGKAVVFCQDMRTMDAVSSGEPQSGSSASGTSGGTGRCGRPLSTCSKSSSNTSLRSFNSSSRTSSNTSLRSSNANLRSVGTNNRSPGSSQKSSGAGSRTNTGNNPKSSTNISPRASYRNKPVSSSSSVPRPRRDSHSKKDGVISNSPTITTYKAVKRGTSSIIPNTSIDGMDQRTKRQATAAPHVPQTSSVKLPASIRNIQKLSSMDDPLGNHINKEGKENVNELLNSFEKRTNVVSKSSTRLTNANEPMRVDQKTWSATYNSNAAYNNANGMPRTDPEPVVPPVRSGPRRTSLRRSGSENTQDATVRRLNLKVNSPETNFTRGVPMRDKSSSSISNARNRNSLTEGLLTPEDKRASNRWSLRSDISADEFHTPPSSPRMFAVSSPKTPSPPSASDVTSDTSGLTSGLTTPKWDPPTSSPKDWKVNPIYGDDSQTRLSKPQPVESKPEPQKKDNVIIGAVTQVTKTSELDSNHNFDENYIDLNAFPDDAPDHTLIKPSKLRESMKKRSKGGRPDIKSNKTTGDSNNNVTEDRSFGSLERDKTSTEQLKPEPVDFMPEHNESAIKVPAFRPNKPVSPYDNVKPSGAGENGYLHQAMVEDNPPDNSLLTPSKLRESMRRKKLERSNTADSKEEASRIHVKKVWSPETKSSNLDIANDNAAAPKTDPELRKAYFRQLEEIKSLREQIMLKDKRIGQLEEEVKHLRDQREMDESTC